MLLVRKFFTTNHIRDSKEDVWDTELDAYIF